jgi:hypothetical protein
MRRGNLFFFKIVKEELQKQLFIIENDLHPYYKKENFKVKFLNYLIKILIHHFFLLLYKVIGLF